MSTRRYPRIDLNLAKVLDQLIAMLLTSQGNIVFVFLHEMSRIAGKLVGLLDVGKLIQGIVVDDHDVRLEGLQHL